uniref:Uncharacterized protein n=1 Tax=Urocitellus parryii TaxID=9999 RepID=A0A8D2H787_UROPR
MEWLRNQKSEVGKAQQEQAIRPAMEAKKAKQAFEKGAMTVAKASTSKSKPVKVLLHEFENAKLADQILK